MFPWKRASGKMSSQRASLKSRAAINADLIITTTRGDIGMKHLFLRSTAENVVRQAPCPVLVLHEEEHDFVDPMPA